MKNLISAYSMPTTNQGSDRYCTQMEEEKMMMEAERHLIEGVTGSRNGRDSNDKMEYTDIETKKKRGRCNRERKGGKSTAWKSNKISYSPSRSCM
jgi:hypothetical protein